MKKIVLFVIILILDFLLFVTFFNKRVSYEMYSCAYCGAGRTVEGRLIGKSVRQSPPWFPSENPPEHEHLYILLASHSSGAYFDFSSDEFSILGQLRKLKEKNQLPDEVIKEWFSIDIGNPEVLSNFAQKHNLEISKEDKFK